MVENFFTRSDYTRIFSCATCSKGYIAKSKYNQPGFRESEQYLCRYCGINSTIGDIVYESKVYLDFPLRYRLGMVEVETKDEYNVFLNIWLTATAGPMVVMDDNDYQLPRDPNLFPLHDYLPPKLINNAQDDKLFDMNNHCNYINSEEGRRRLLNRINHGDFGNCPYCGTNLYPIATRSKPFIRSYILNCPRCTFATSGDADGVYFHGWIDDLSKKFLQMLPSNFRELMYITSESSMNLFEELKIIEEENETLDFKEKYTINTKKTSLTDGAKKELRKDICAFANNKGGNIFIGIREINSSKTELIGLSDEHQKINTQEFIDQISSSGDLNPSIPNVNLHKIFYNSRWYFIIKISKSNIAPHFIGGKIPCRFSKITKYFSTEEEWKESIQ